MYVSLWGGLARLGPSRARRAVWSLAACVLVSGALWLLAAGGARADTSALCAGYGGCAAAPFTTHGYQANAGVSWWRMYPGDNCTNYAAFVESQVYEVPEPAGLLGNADQWAANAAAQGIDVDATPSVGSVAAWGSGARGMGSDGHVAVVEAVGPDHSYIDVSQSGMGDANDGYDWERIYPSGGSWASWPSAFIHFTGPPTRTAFPQPGMRVAGAEITIPGAE